MPEQERDGLQNPSNLPMLLEPGWNFGVVVVAAVAVLDLPVGGLPVILLVVAAVYYC